MSVNDIIMTAGGASAPATYIEDVFSTYLYTGNSSTQTITNGIDLAGKGGLVWVKGRTQSTMSHSLTDTVRGANKVLRTNFALAEEAFQDVTGYTSSGFSVSSNSTNFTNLSNESYVSWTFRKAPKFFDVVTFTVSSNPQTINHSLGAIPGMIVLKATSVSQDWTVGHRSTTNAFADYLELNGTGAAIANASGISNVTASSFTVTSFTNGATYVAYIFAHDPSPNGLIQCGSFTTDGSGNATVNLGWEPQYLMVKRSSGTSNWMIVDSMRGVPTPESSTQAVLKANLSDAEANSKVAGVSATGFYTNSFTYEIGASSTYIYMAIRRPNKPPTSGTEVFAPVLWTANSPDPIQVFTSFAPDFATRCQRSKVNDNGLLVGTRLTGPRYLNTPYTNAEETYLDMLFKWDKPGGNAAIQFGATSASNGMSSWLFRRAPGFFDVVCNTGNGATLSASHNLTVAPELIIRKSRSIAGDHWRVGYSFGATSCQFLVLNSTGAASTMTYNSADVFSAKPTATTFGIGSGYNTSAETYVNYLFASLPGISKVGSYTGNGSSQTINCGFAAGARFILIKRTDNTGDWYVWDTARGIVAGNDPHLSLNTTAAEVTTDDTIDPDASGFIVNQVSATNVNVNAASYIYLAIA